MRKILCLTICCILGLQISFAQELRVKGVVTSSDDGNPIPGVSVVIKGTTIGMTTNIDGAYSIEMPEGKMVLIFSFVGMKTQEITATDNSPLNVVLESDTKAIDEVFVVAYGTAKKASFTGSAATVKSEAINRIPVSSVEKALTGMVSGLSVSNSSGQPGSASSVRIRGMGSFSAGNEPLYVIDGIPVASGSLHDSGGNLMSTINPGDIETLTVLKDAAAASLYGSRAANGVILITTKQGKAGKTKFNLKTSMGFSDFATDNFENVKGEDYLTLLRESMVNAGMDEDEITDEMDDNGWAKPANGFVDWKDELFRTGVTKNMEFSASGGNKKTKFYLSANVFDQEGIAKYSDLTRYTGRINLTHKLNDKLKLGVNLVNAKTEQNIQSGGSSYSNPFYFLSRKAWPTESPYDENGELKEVLHGNSYNIIREYELNEQSANIYRSTSSAWAEYEILEGLTAKTTASYDWINNDEIDYSSPESRAGRRTNGSMEKTNRKKIRATSSSILTYDKTFSEMHHVNILAGFEVESSKSEYYKAYGTNIPSKNIKVLSTASGPAEVSGSKSEKRLISYLSRFNYDFKNKYYLSASIRRDGSSKLGENERWANFWSLSGSYRLSEEEFMKDLKFIDNLKVRASYGTSGNLPSSYYGYQQLYSYSGSYNSVPAGIDVQYENQNLTWEKNHNLSLAAEVSFLNRLTCSFEYFKRRTSDLLVDVPISNVTGFNSTWQNVGEMENKGFEIELKSENVKTDNFRWATNFNLTHVKNKIVKLYNNEPISGTTSIKIEGQPYYTFYLRPWAGVNTENGKPQWYVVDEEGKYEYETNAEGKKLKKITNDYGATNQMIAGSPDPDFYGGITNTLSYKGVELSFLFNFAVGGKIWYSSGYKSWRDGASSASYSFQEAQLDRWQKPGDKADHPQRIWDRDDDSAAYSTRFLFDNDFIRLKNVSLAYNFPKSITNKVKLSSLRVYAQATNLLTFAEQDLCDPEQSYSGRTTFEIPNTKTITFGVELGF
jgi:TonB-linked SusC/RagA family outer membrane protein